MKNLVIILILLFLTTPVYGTEEIILTGIPVMKISEGGSFRTPETLSNDQAIKYKCTISKIDDKYYWTTRENVELLPIVSGAFITFIASNGSGYVRMVIPEMKESVSLMGETEEKFDYVEHLLLGLKTISYYGTSQ